MQCGPFVLRCAETEAHVPPPPPPPPTPQSGKLQPVWGLKVYCAHRFLGPACHMQLWELQPEVIQLRQAAHAAGDTQATQAVHAAGVRGSAQAG